MGKKITVTSETSTGMNKTFHDNYKNKNLNRREFVKEVKNGNYLNFHVRTANDIETPVSNPDKSTLNNLE